MTTLSQAREAIYQMFIDTWEGVSPYTFDNEQYEPPPSSAWVRFSVRHDRAAQETLGHAGNRRFLRSGIVYLQLFIPVNQGMSSADVLATTAREIFEGVSSPGSTNIRFYNVAIREIGIDTSTWFQINIEADFEYDETR